MPIPTLSRLNRPLSPPTNTVGPAHPSRSSHARNRTMSPPLSNTSYSPTITSGIQQQKLNVVTRVAIEGKARQDQDGAAVKMYLKISLPLESVTPGSTIPLFPEEDVKILTSQVHPIDNNSVPYNFSSTISPLLHHAARALNLPARSSESYHSIFGLSPPRISTSIPSSNRSSKTNGSSSHRGENLAPIDAKYTGHILVSGYNISYVLPKEFPPRCWAGGSPTDNEGDSSSRSFKRRLSAAEKNVVHFMAAIDMWVPYISRPPRSPYLLSIPTPRCLHNNIKLRIFPPTATSSSFASLSSADEDAGSWDLTSDPHVTRSASTRLSRSTSYTHFADDESSDSSTTAGFPDGCGIQGTFPSAERIRVRWAKAMKTIDVMSGGDERRRVGVKDVKGEMTCVVKGKARDREKNSTEGVIMDVEYKGTCKGVWFPGVATMLGMDVGLEAKGSDVSWIPGLSNEWEIDGGAGYTGFDVGASPRTGPASRHSSTDSSSSPHIFLSPSSPDGGPLTRQRQTSTSSTSSLLRAPLPVQNVAEYSFEGSTTTSSSSASSPFTATSSMGSLLPASTPNFVQSSDPHTRPPGVPITLHINMNELLPPAKNTFTFNIAGTILVTPRAVPRAQIQNLNSRSSSSGGESETDVDPEPVVLPRFTILAADSESTSIVIRNDVDGNTGAGANVEVYNSTGDIYRDAQTRKTVLQKGGFTRCGEDGGRIALRSVRMQNGVGRPLHPISRPRTPTGNANGNVISRIPSNSSLRQMFPFRPRRDGPLMIPSVVATVTPLVPGAATFLNAYAVRVCLPAPADTDSEWLEFGLGQPGPISSMLSDEGASRKLPRVEIANASVEGVPVRFETTAAVKQEPDSGLRVPFEEMSGREWVSWVRVHTGRTGGAVVVIDYVVRDGDGDSGTSAPEKGKLKGKAKKKYETNLNIFLPTFSLPVGRLEVHIDTISGIDISSLRSNFRHQQMLSNGRRLLHYSMEEFFYPHLSLTVHPSPAQPGPRSTNSYLAVGIFCLAFFLIYCSFGIMAEMRQMGHTLESYSIVMGSGWNDAPEPVTVTTTVYTGSRWWFGEVAAETGSVSQPPNPQGSVTTVISSPSTPSPSFSDTHHIPTMPTPSEPPAETYALLPIQNLPFSWPLQFEYRTVRVTFDKILEKIDVIWQTFRKIYHYPLDPT